jgi:hypothetical protein
MPHAETIATDMNNITPIKDCSHKHAVDGCCNYPDTMNAECHIWACPRIDSRLEPKYVETKHLIELGESER